MLLEILLENEPSTIFCKAVVSTDNREHMQLLPSVTVTLNTTTRETSPFFCNAVTNKMADFFYLSYTYSGHNKNGLYSK